MNIYVKINGVKYSIQEYNYRRNNVNSDIQVSNIFTCTVVADESSIINVSDQIDFYSDDVLIYTDPINSVIKNRFRFEIESEKTINATANKTLNVKDISLYSSNTVRSKLNFDIVPLDEVVTEYGSFIAKTVTHYSNISEFSYG